MRIRLFHTVLFSLLAVMPLGTLAASGETLPLDVQCWRSIGLDESPPPGQLAALVQQCVRTLRFDAAAKRTVQEQELRKEALLERARVQSKNLTRVRRGVKPHSDDLVPDLPRQRLPSNVERRNSLNTARIYQQRQRHWTFLPEGLRTRALLADRRAARECLTRMDISVEECANNIIATSASGGVPPALPEQYRDQKHVMLSVGESTVTGEGITIQLLRVMHDTRCIRGRLCLWTGEVGVSVRIFSQAIVDNRDDLTLQAPKSLIIPGTEPEAFAPPTSANTVPVGRCTVAFVQLLPYPVEELSSNHETLYQATFVVLNPQGLFSCGE